MSSLTHTVTVWGLAAVLGETREASPCVPIGQGAPLPPGLPVHSLKDQAALSVENTAGAGVRT